MVQLLIIPWAQQTGACGAALGQLNRTHTDHWHPASAPCSAITRNTNPCTRFGIESVKSCAAAGVRIVDDLLPGWQGEVYQPVST